MEKISELIKGKEPGPAPAPTPCRRCNKPSESKLVPFIGWHRQEYCEACAELVAEEREKEREKAWRRERVSSLIKTSGIKGLMLDMTFGAFDQKLSGAAHDIAKEYAEKFGKETTRGLLLYGKAGSGKTHLAVAIARHLIEQRMIPVRFARIVDLLSEIRQTFDENERYRTENEADLIQKYISVPLLILDDLGAEKTTDWVRQLLYQIIDERWIEQKPIIVTSNLNLEEIEARFEERIASRIAGMCRLIETRPYDHRLGNKEV